MVVVVNSSTGTSEYKHTCRDTDSINWNYDIVYFFYFLSYHFIL